MKIPQKIKLLYDNLRTKRTLRKVEKALGFKLYDWQKAFIFENKPYGFEIASTRRSGKTLAHILRLCLSEGEPIHISKRTYPYTYARPCRQKKTERILIEYLGSDSYPHFCAKHAVDMLWEIYGLLKSKRGIKLREITFGGDNGAKCL